MNVKIKKNILFLFGILCIALLSLMLLNSYGIQHQRETMVNGPGFTLAPDLLCKMCGMYKEKNISMSPQQQSLCSSCTPIPEPTTYTPTSEPTTSQTPEPTTYTPTSTSTIATKQMLAKDTDTNILDCDSFMTYINGMRINNAYTGMSEDKKYKNSKSINEFITNVKNKFKECHKWYNKTPRATKELKNADFKTYIDNIKVYHPNIGNTIDDDINILKQKLWTQKQRKNMKKK